VVRERQAIEVDESVAHGVHESVRRRLPSGVPEAALVEPRRRGHPVVRVSTAREGGHKKAEEEEERVDGGGEQSGGQGGEQVERLHCWLLGFLELLGSFWQKKIHKSRLNLILHIGIFLILILFFLDLGKMNFRW
jgi:hypothetical protein